MPLFRSKNRTGELAMSYFGHPSLREQSVEVTDIDDEIRDLSKRMIETMRAHDGIGLAAPQIGINIRMVVLEVPQPEPDAHAAFPSPGEMALHRLMPFTIINPTLSDMSEETSVFQEGCLSIPGVTGDVERPTYVQLKAQDLSGQDIDYRCGGLLARCLQHEQDHLDGVLFTDLLTAEALTPHQATLRKLKKKTLAALKRSR